jgi:endo-beta-N-acetylglucosaminidase D
MFFEMCDGIFLNYTWGSDHLTRSNEIIKRYYPDRKYDIFVGIDVFGRGQLAQMESNKVTGDMICQLKKSSNVVCFIDFCENTSQ